MPCMPAGPWRKRSNGRHSTVSISTTWTYGRTSGSWPKKASSRAPGTGRTGFRRWQITAFPLWRYAYRVILGSLRRVLRSLRNMPANPAGSQERSMTCWTTSPGILPRATRIRSSCLTVTRWSRGSFHGQSSTGLRCPFPGTGTTAGSPPARTGATGRWSTRVRRSFPTGAS